MSVSVIKEIKKKALFFIGKRCRMRETKLFFQFVSWYFLTFTCKNKGSDNRS